MLTPKPIVAAYSNYAETIGSKHELIPENPRGHDYELYRPKLLRRSHPRKGKHMSALDGIKLLLSVVHFCFVHRRASVFLADSMQTGVVICAALFFFRSKRIIIWGYNVPRRRTGLARMVMAPLMRRADRIVTFGTHDIEFTSSLYGIDTDRFTFIPYSRLAPNPDPETISPFGDDPFVIAVGANARDYATLLTAIAPLDVNLLIIARKYNIEGLEIPANTRVLYNLGLDQCDELTRRASFMVMPLDATEPSCGQVTLVTAFMLNLPVIATSCTGTQDYIVDDQTGILTELADAEGLRKAIIDLWQDTAKRKRLAENAFQWLEMNASTSARHSRIDSIVEELTSERDDLNATRT